MASHHLLIELRAEGGHYGLVLAPVIPGMTDAESVELYRMQADQRRTTILDHMIANQVRAGILGECSWQVAGWLRITDAESQADFSALIPPGLVEPEPPRKRSAALNRSAALSCRSRAAVAGSATIGTPAGSVSA